MTNDVTATDKIAAYTTVRSDIAEMVPRDAMSILDVGCSNGELGASLRTAVPGRKVSGIEFNKTFADVAASRLDLVVHANLDAFNWETEFLDTSFDCIIFADVLEHLADPERHLCGALGHLTTGGSIVISLPNIRHFSAFVSIFLGGRFPRRTRGLFDATHLHWFTISDAHHLLAKSGLIVNSESFSLRIGDLGGGKINKLLNKFTPSIKRTWLIREFLTYQFCLRACQPAASTPSTKSSAE